MAAVIETENGITALERGQLIKVGPEEQGLFIFASHAGGTWVGFRTEGKLLSFRGKVKVKPEGLGLYGPNSWVKIGPVKITNQLG